MANSKTLNEDYGTIMMISGDEKNRQAISRTVKRVYKRKKNKSRIFERNETKWTSFLIL